MENKLINSCVQCHKELKLITWRIEENEYPALFCLDAKCSNYGLVQLGEKLLSEFLAKEGGKNE